MRVMVVMAGHPLTPVAYTWGRKWTFFSDVRVEGEAESHLPDALINARPVCVVVSHPFLWPLLLLPPHELAKNARLF